MKYYLYVLAAGLAVSTTTLAQSTNTQSSSTEFITDINGHLVPDAQYAAHNGDTAQVTQSINGRQVPLETSETRVLTDEPNHRVTETIVHRYDSTGQPGSTERTVTDETKTAAGSTIHASVFQSDVNGHMQESERRVVDTHVQGATTTADVTISRLGLNGDFAPAEKRQVVTAKEGDTIRETETIERPTVNGSQFYEAARVVKEETKTPDKTTTSTTVYEPDYQSKLALSRQDVATTTKAGDGTQVTELDTYAPSTYSVAREANSTPKLREQHVTVRRENNGAVTETTTVRRPTVSDPNRLADDAVSTVVCTGNCKSSLPAPAVKP